jgi:hypothetical protein
LNECVGKCKWETRESECIRVAGVRTRERRSQCVHERSMKVRARGQRRGVRSSESIMNASEYGGG